MPYGSAFVLVGERSLARRKLHRQCGGSPNGQISISGHALIPCIVLLHVLILCNATLLHVDFSFHPQKKKHGTFCSVVGQCSSAARHASRNYPAVFTRATLMDSETYPLGNANAILAWCLGILTVDLAPVLLPIGQRLERPHAGACGCGGRKDVPQRL